MGKLDTENVVIRGWSGGAQMVVRTQPMTAIACASGNMSERLIVTAELAEPGHCVQQDLWRHHDYEGRRDDERRLIPLLQ